MDVRERQYEIARKDKGPNALTTGFLFSCFAVYGWNEAKKVGFLWHIDAHPCGLDRIVKRLRIDVGDDLNGFDVYMTSGLGLYFRILAALLVAAIAIVEANKAHKMHEWIGGGVAVIGLLSYLLRNWILVCFRVWRVFGTWCSFQHVSLSGRITYAKKLFQAIRAGGLNKRRILQWPRTEVTVDAERGPEPLVLEIGDAQPSSKDRFESTRESCVFHRPMRVAVAKRRRRAAGSQCVMAMKKVRDVLVVLVIAGVVMVGAMKLADMGRKSEAAAAMEPRRDGLLSQRELAAETLAVQLSKQCAGDRACWERSVGPAVRESVGEPFSAEQRDVIQRDVLAIGERAYGLARQGERKL